MGSPQGPDFEIRGFSMSGIIEMIQGLIGNFVGGDFISTITGVLSQLVDFVLGLVGGFIPSLARG